MKALTGRWATTSQSLRTGLGIGGLVLVLIGLIAFQFLRPLPVIAATILQPQSSQLGTSPVALPWPKTGSASVAISGLGTVGTFGPQTALPLASTAKVMTAMLILEDHPLQPTDPGPMVPVSAADVASYQAEKTQGQSVFPVVAGEQITEYQMLQALLVPSGNNVAELLASWDAGSVLAFVDRMNARAATLGLRQTHYADVSGVSADSVGSPGDLITLAEFAMRNPVFAEIVAQPEATLPVAGRVFNVDAALGQDGIIGVKTGSSAPAGACFVFAADVKADQQPARIVGAVMGLPTLDEAFTAVRNLIHAIGPGLHTRSVLSTYQVVAEYAAPWGDRATVFADQDVSWIVLDGMTLYLRPQLRQVKAPLPSGTSVGTVTLQVGERRTQVPLKTTEPIFEPDLFWRLTRLRPGGLF